MAVIPASQEFSRPVSEQALEKPPLVLDLDGTLLRTDATVEHLLVALQVAPIRAIAALFQGLGSRAAMKQALVDLVPLQTETLPVNAPVALFASAEKMAGRDVYIVTGSHQAIADGIRSRMPFLDGVKGTEDVNLKGPAKAEYLARTFPKGYVYAGDSRADGAVWAGADAGILVGENRGGMSAFEASGCAEEARFNAPSATISDWFQQLRLHQWAKNALLFVAMFVGHVFTDPVVWGTVVFGFLCLGVVASGTYVLNDLLDLDADRRHRTKRLRPLAAGRIKLVHGLIAGPGLIAGGVLASLILPPAFTGFLVAYLALTMAYSLSFKRTALFDTISLASLFSLRIAMGAALAGVALSQWLLVFSMFFFFSLSVAKRHGELSRPGLAPDAFLPGRGYRGSDVGLTRSLGVAAACGSVLILVMYLTEGAFGTGDYANPTWLWALPMIVATWLCHLWLNADRGDLDDDPVLFALKDRLSLGLAAACAVSFGFAIIGLGA